MENFETLWKKHFIKQRCVDSAPAAKGEDFVNERK
jgi:hypothetical protein